MPETITGIVKNGVIIPDTQLPEGTSVEIRVPSTPEIPPELQEEFDAWERAGAGSIELVEKLADEMETDEKR